LPLGLKWLFLATYCLDACDCKQQDSDLPLGHKKPPKHPLQGLLSPDEKKICKLVSDRIYNLSSVIKPRSNKSSNGVNHQNHSKEKDSDQALIVKDNELVRCLDALFATWN